jgi:hypothetical protein
MSIIAVSSASWTGLSQTGSGLPSWRILTRSVVAAMKADMMLMRADMQKGALWCSLVITASKPASSARL